MISVDIEKKILEKITPTAKDKEKLEAVVQDLKNKVKKEIEKRKLSISIELVGSIAKDTYLKNNLDIDLFLLFPTTVSREKLEKNGLLIGRSILKDTEECYAEHPYVRGYYKNYNTEIVPCYKIESISQKLSAVDRTPLHTKYAEKHLSESQKKEVRLFKQFLRGIGCYGAETEIEGFSGYLCEILIMKYKSFQKLLQNAQRWQYGKELHLHKVDYPDFDTPLVFIDPVDSKRNVASALSKEKFDLFVTACKEYVQNPRVTFFFPNKIKPWSLDKIKTEIEKQTGYFIGIKIAKPDTISENLYPQMRKAVHSIKEVCEQYDFTIIDERFHVDHINNAVYIILQANQELLSKTHIHKGPPAKLKKNVGAFIQKWQNDERMIKKPYEKDGRLYVEIERDYIDIKNLLKGQIKNLSLGKHINEMVKKGYNILEPEDLTIDDLRHFWTIYLDNKRPWEI